MEFSARVRGSNITSSTDLRSIGTVRPSLFCSVNVRGTVWGKRVLVCLVVCCVCPNFFWNSGCSFFVLWVTHIERVNSVCCRSSQEGTASLFLDESINIFSSEMVFVFAWWEICLFLFCIFFSDKWYKKSKWVCKRIVSVLVEKLSDWVSHNQTCRETVEFWLLCCPKQAGYAG